MNATPKRGVCCHCVGIVNKFINVGFGCYRYSFIVGIKDKKIITNRSMAIINHKITFYSVFTSEYVQAGQSKKLAGF